MATKGSKTTIDDIIQGSICVSDGFVVVDEKRGNERGLNVTAFAGCFPETVSTNLYVITLVHDGNVYITPHTDKKYSYLQRKFESAGFSILMPGERPKHSGLLPQWGQPETAEEEIEAVQKKAATFYDAKYGKIRLMKNGKALLHGCKMVDENGTKLYPWTKEVVFPLVSRNDYKGRTCFEGCYFNQGGTILFLGEEGETYAHVGLMQNFLVDELEKLGYMKWGT